MTLDPTLRRLRDLVARDPGGRGLATDPADNLLTAAGDDFVGACRSVAATPRLRLTVVTGFHIPAAGCGETDGPPGALFLARSLVPLGVGVVLASDAAGLDALREGVRLCGLAGNVPVVPLPAGDAALGRPTHLVAIERVGPAHTPASVLAQPGATDEDRSAFLAAVPPEHHGRCHTMRGRDITDVTADAWSAFEYPASGRPITIGVGDGGNEIGMGKVRWDTIRRNVPGGGIVACRVPADFLIVAGVSNWGAYALAAGVALSLGRRLPRALFDPDAELRLLERLVAAVPLVDGVTGRREAGVDGLPWSETAGVLTGLRELAGD